MANLVGCVAMSHAPQLMLDPEQLAFAAKPQGENLPDKPELASETDEVKWTKWKGCMSAIDQLRQKVAALRPDVLIVVGDDQHENLVDDNMPPFTIFMGADAEASVSLRYLNQAKSENRTKYQHRRQDGRSLSHRSHGPRLRSVVFEKNPLRRRPRPRLRPGAQVSHARKLTAG